MLGKKAMLEYKDGDSMDSERVLILLRSAPCSTAVGDICDITWSIHFTSSNNHHEGHTGRL